MSPANRAVVANLNGLRAATNAALRAQGLASQDGTMAEWTAARVVAKAASVAECAEIARIRAAGFDGDVDFEFAVLGRLERRHAA